MTNQEILDSAEAFVAQHLRECCIELRAFTETGLLPNGRVRDVAEMVRPVVNTHAQVHAIRIIELAAIRECATDPVNDRLASLIEDLRQNDRLKWACDYAVTHKYREYHLLTNSVFVDKIVEVAAAYEIVFTTINTY